MRFFKYCYFRMYRAYEAKNDSPFLRALIYISILELSILAILFINLKEMVLRLSGINELNIEKPLYVWTVAGIILLLNYFFYTRLNMNELEKLFESHSKMNKYIKLWMLIAFPFIILIGGLVIYVLMFGGIILGGKVEGIF